ncbi:MAG TPA: cupin domain-containing protein [Vicinamibacterales bacterium]|nr:cupin domain-containing protein [Vicinamibacterales bacterium]
MRKPLVPGMLRIGMLLIMTIAMTIAAAPLGAQRRGSTGPVTLAVLVSDPSGAPIADVRVALTGPAQRNGRTEAGRIVFEDLPTGAYRFRFEKDGYVPLEREVTGRGSAPINLKITLTRVPPPPPAPVDQLPAPPVNARAVVLDMPAFIEKNYVGRAAGKATPLACSAGGPATLMQINEPVPTHTHPDADEFIYVIAGQGTAVIGDRQESLSAGVFVLIPRGTAHAFTAGPKKPLVLVSTRAGEKCQ